MGALLTAGAVFAICGTSLAQVPKVVSQAGQVLNVRADYPAGDGPFPGVVLAPGQGYHMALPALERTAAELVARGIVVFRFDWSYLTRDPQNLAPSADLAVEVDEMKAVLAALRRDRRVQAENVFVAGKSMGSVVAWRVLESDPTLRGGLFLTPSCSRLESGQAVPVSYAEQNYPRIDQQTRPLAFVGGEKDPLCASAILYRFAAKAAGPVRVNIVGGDHVFRVSSVPGPAGDALAEINISLAAQLAADFVAVHSRR